MELGKCITPKLFLQVKWGALFSGFDDETYAENINTGILLTVGFLPGLKVDVIPLLRPTRVMKSLYKLPNFALSPISLRSYNDNVLCCIKISPRLILNDAVGVLHNSGNETF